MSLSLGAINGGPEVSASPFGVGWRKISCSIREKRGDVEFGTVPELNVVFHVPGSLLKPEHVGLRTGRFSTKDKAFMIQVAVPEEMVSSDRASDFIFESIREATHMAKPRFDKHKMEFSVEEHLAFLDEIEAEFKASEAVRGTGN